MSNRLQDMVRAVFWGSLASLAATNTSAGVEFHPADHGMAERVGAVEKGVQIKQDLKPKLLLKINQVTDEWSYITHRSHRSHRSHSSHRSHYSSRTSTPKPSTRTPSPTPSYNTSNQNLGDRLLSKNDIGSDVSQLMRLLIDKSYLSNRNLQSIEIYSQEVESAVRALQKDFNLVPDGIAGSATIAVLKASGGMSLGSRTLKKGMTGEDVAELMRILIRRKYLMQRTLQRIEVFTEAVEEAVKAFQKDNNMMQTGIVDPATTLLLKNL